MSKKPLVWCYEFEDAIPFIGVTKEAQDMLGQHFELITPSLLKQSPKRVGEIEGVVIGAGGVAPSPLTQLENMTSLKVVSNWGAGVNHLSSLFPALKDKGVKMSYAPNAVTKGTADMAMALLLASARNILAGHEEATGPGHEKLLRINVHGEEVNEAVIGIVGMGRIGMEVAKRARGFDMKVLYHNRSRRSEEEETKVDAKYYPSLDEMLPLCDYVVLTCPLTEETKHIIGDKQFSLMKKSSTIVNVARGAVINTEALVAALREKKIRAAALDVTDPEPLPAVHPLLELDNAIIQPHRGSACNKTRRKMWQAIVDGLKAVLIDNMPIPDHVRYDL